jgi:hypothetical protein
MAWALTPIPSSRQRTSQRQSTNAGTPRARVCERQLDSNPGSGVPKDSSILPCACPLEAIAASALVTSSGMICTKSMPPWAKFSLK